MPTELIRIEKMIDHERTLIGTLTPEERKFALLSEALRKQEQLLQEVVSAPPMIQIRDGHACVSRVQRTSDGGIAMVPARNAAELEGMARAEVEAFMGPNFDFTQPAGQSCSPQLAAQAQWD
jgi:hypothetical protein